MRTLGGFLLAATMACFAVAQAATTPGDAAVQAQQFENGAELYKRGAEQGDSEAALKLGLLVSQGHVSPDNYGSAVDWFRKACDAGNLAGCHNAAVAFEYGRHGVEKDYAKARDFYLRAADRGYMQAQYNLGSLYSNGHMVPANDAEGLRWMLIAERSALKCRNVPLCRFVVEDPPNHRQRLRSRLSVDEQQTAEFAAAKWKPAR